MSTSSFIQILGFGDISSTSQSFHDMVWECENVSLKCTFALYTMILIMCPLLLPYGRKFSYGANCHILRMLNPYVKIKTAKFNYSCDL